MNIGVVIWMVFIVWLTAIILYQQRVIRGLRAILFSQSNGSTNKDNKPKGKMDKDKNAKGPLDIPDLIVSRCETHGVENCKACARDAFLARKEGLVTKEETIAGLERMRQGKGLDEMEIINTAVLYLEEGLVDRIEEG